MQNLTSYVLFTERGESSLLPGLECRSLFQLGHMHKDVVAQELSSIGSGALLHLCLLFGQESEHY